MSIIKKIQKKQILHKVVSMATIMVFMFQTTFMPMVQAQQKSKAGSKISTTSRNAKNATSIGKVAPGGPTKTSVNLATGKVNLSIPLGSVKHASSPGFSLSAKYNSNTLASYKVWNVEAPTNDTGVGWKLSSHNTIVRYTNETGNENDDTFYWFNGGTSRELVYSKTDKEGDHYKLKHEMKNTRIVRKFATDDTPGSWVITTTNGTRYTYGGTAGKDPRPPKPAKTPAETVLLQICQYIYAHYTPLKYNPALDCDTGSVESMVKWGNWIGPSQQAKNQENFETAWHLSKITNIAGNDTTLSYVQVVQAVGTDPQAKRFSKGAYLYKVTQKNKETLLLKYVPRKTGPKGAKDAEYVDPWYMNDEPDGYQERLRTLYLGSVDYYNAYGKRISASELEYGFLTTKSSDAHMQKRVLIGVKYLTYKPGSSSGKLVSPAYKFTYWDSGDDVSVTLNGEKEKVFNFNSEKDEGALYGAIKSVTSPTGAVTTYSYKANTLALERKIELPSELTDRKVLFGNDYALVMGGGGKFPI